MTGVPAAVVAVIPSPSQGVWFLGPLPVRAYALCILVGILVAIQLGERRWVQRGGTPGAVLDIAAWAVPFGIVGGRLYHVATTWQPYFGADGDPVKALFIWEGGLGIWGAVLFGGVGAWIGARRAGILLPPLADALAPGIVLAQAIGRWGNWFNNELYGRATDLPWALRIYEWDASAGHAVLGADGKPEVLGTFHPAFLYESVWNVGVAGALIWADRRFRLGHGRVFALYALLYTLGRGWIEALRVDDANRILGLRLNLWTSLLVGLGALAYLVISARLRPGRETSVVRGAEPTDLEAGAGEAGDPEAGDPEAGSAGARDEGTEDTTEELEAEALRKAAAKDDVKAEVQAADGKAADGKGPVSPDSAKDPVVSMKDSARKVSQEESVSTASNMPPDDARPGPGHAKEGVPADEGVPGSRVSDARRSNSDS